MMKRLDRRASISLLLVVATLAAGALLHVYQRGIGESSPLFSAKPGDGLPASSVETTLHAAFQRAVVLQHSGHAEAAVGAWEQVLNLAPDLPEAHVNKGFALVDLDDCDRAQLSFDRALALRAQQENAYYGQALCHERQGDLDLALGAMRVYVHLADDESPYVRRAMAAIWEWSAGRSAAETSKNNIDSKTASVDDG